MPSPRPAQDDCSGGDAPTVPLTVWTIPFPADHGQPLPRPAADRLLASYSEPGDLVAALDAPVELTDACHAFGRRHLPLSDRTGPHDRPRLPLLALRTFAYPCQLVVDDQTGRPAVDPPAAAHLTGLYTDTLRLLAPAGRLVVVVDDRTDQAPSDVLAETVKAARAAGFLYLQHVVVLRAPVRDSQLDVDEPPPGQRPVTGTSDTVRRLHTDLAVFLRPGTSR